MPQRTSAFAAFIERNVPGADGLTLTELGEKLGGINPAMLSRLRSGSQLPGRATARRIAQALGKTPEGVDRLTRDILVPDGSIGQHRLRRNIWAPRGVGLFVELREAIGSSSDARTNKGMAKLICQGMSYGMLLAHVRRTKERATRVSPSKAVINPSTKIDRFLNDVHDRVVESYSNLREEIVRQIVAGSTSDPEINQRASEADARVKLFVLSEAAVGILPAVAFRVFLKARDRSHRRCWWDPEAVDADEHPQNRIVEFAENDSLEVGAIEARFSPVLDYFDWYHELPTSNAELEQFEKKVLRRRSLPQSKALKPWRLYEPTPPFESIQSIVARVKSAQRT